MSYDPLFDAAQKAVDGVLGEGEYARLNRDNPGVPRELRQPAPKCTWCEEPVLAGEQHDAFHAEAMHVECGFRTVVGSVAHVLRRCNCFKMGSSLSDPPDLTKREAARAAMALWQQVWDWYGEEAEPVLWGRPVE